jgi:hypothetical protein
MSKQAEARRFWRLFMALYPFGAGAAAVNLFFASLITSWIGWPVLSPQASVLWGLPLGLPLTYLFSRHICGLMTQVDRRPGFEPSSALDAEQETQPSR